MESLEQKIKNLNHKHDKIWYFADGVYSMYGDFAPFNQLTELLNKYDKFHLYIDDAHGMGWAGHQGCGVVRSAMGHPDKMVLAVSLNKSFAAAGGCIVFPNETMEREVRNCGATYIFCGPIQPPMLGAANASAQLHRSEEFYEKQAALQARVAYINQQLAALSLPQYKETDSPLFFIPVGLPKTTYDIVNKMKADGYYLNTASFPPVPMKKSGVRFMANSHLSFDEIDGMLESLQKHYISTITAAGSSCQSVAKAFGIPTFDIPLSLAKSTTNRHKHTLKYELTRSIKACDKADWNTCFRNKGNLDYDNIALVEQAFTNQQLPENNWDFYYLTVKDEQGHTVLKSFFTAALVKDDMFAPAHVSEKVEGERQTATPYHLTSKSIISGTLITKGNQVYIDRNHLEWKAALKLYIDCMAKAQADSKAASIMLRDFYGEQDPEFQNTLLELGFIHQKLPNNCVVPSLSWNSTDEYLKGLSQKYRYNVRREILKYAGHFEVAYDKPTSRDTLQQYYALYERVYEKSYGLNVFKLPFHYFEAMATNPNYDFVQLYLKGEAKKGHVAESPVLAGVMFSYINNGLYNALIVGLDYDYVYSHNTYKQILYQTMLRAKQLGCASLDLAFTAELEKKKIGAKPIQVSAYVQASEHYSHSVIAAM